MSSLSLKINFFLDIFFCLKSDIIIKIWYFRLIKAILTNCLPIQIIYDVSIIRRSGSADPDPRSAYFYRDSDPQ